MQEADSMDSAEQMRLSRAVRARGLKLIKSRARVLGATSRGGFHLMDLRTGTVIAGAKFDACLEGLAEKILASPLLRKN